MIIFISKKDDGSWDFGDLPTDVLADHLEMIETWPDELRENQASEWQLPSYILDEDFAACLRSEISDRSDPPADL